MSMIADYTFDLRLVSAKRGLGFRRGMCFRWAFRSLSANMKTTIAKRSNEIGLNKASIMTLDCCTPFVGNTAMVKGVLHIQKDRWDTVNAERIYVHAVVQ
jgi:hypothetical protein